MNTYFICASTILVLTACDIITPSKADCKAPSKGSAFQVLVSRTCDQKPFVYQNEGCKECMYLNAKGLKTIGVGFNLERPDARAIIAMVGADYDKIVNGAVTAFATPCDCDSVTCLNQNQIEKIFDGSIAEAIALAKIVISSFASFCCAVQDVVVDISFALGKQTFPTYTPFAYWLAHQNWKAAADFLRTTKWCHVDRTRCTYDADILTNYGCPCSGAYSKKCFTITSSCCGTSQTCCNGSVTFSNYVKKKFQEMLCCNNKNGNCCGENQCCPARYPVCCYPDYCCAAGELCGEGHSCYNPASGVSYKSVPAEVISPTFE